jgi:hypothetical protein
MTDWSFPPGSRNSPASPREGEEVLEVTWDDALGVAHVSHPRGLTLATIAEVERWRAELFAKLTAIEGKRGGRFPIVVCVDGMTIRPTVAEDYGRVARSYGERFASGIARYSRRPNGVGQIITVAAMKEGYRANLFASKSEAVTHVLSVSEAQRSQRGR